MGLLDQVLGQVIGQMTGGAARPQPGQASARPGPTGGLGDLFGGAAGQYSPLIMALLSLLASKGLQGAAGGSILQDILGKLTGQGPGSAGDAPQPRGRSAYPGPADPGEDEQSDNTWSNDNRPPARSGSSASPGGFLDDVGSMLGGPGGSAAPARASGPIGGGLDRLVDQFRRNGQGDAIGSWVGHGQNQAIAPAELDQALGEGTVDTLSRQTGLSRDDLLAQLSQALPQVVDKLTPQGRLPTEAEHQSWI